jgi:hypothetical protein
MTALLDVWIARPGDVSAVDDNPWVIRIYDAHHNAYRYANTRYVNLQARHAHWAGTIPPGTYVLRAKRLVAARDGSDEFTDHAIAVVGCDGLHCVRLYVQGGQPPRPEREPEWPETRKAPKPDEDEKDERHAMHG